VGPAAGNRLARTNADPEGRHVYGTYGNCGNGFTYWNTYLTCEENFTDYFGIGMKREDAAAYLDAEQQAHLQRYIGSEKISSEDYRWYTHDYLFDCTTEPYEYNRHGWIVSIYPFNHVY